MARLNMMYSGDGELLLKNMMLSGEDEKQRCDGSKI
jgi:hypothetical protein